MPFKVGFVGGGAMATALIKGTVSAQLIPATDIFVHDPDVAGMERLKASLGVNISKDNAALASSVDVIVIAVKPHIVPIVLKQIAPVINISQHLVVSVAAGVKIESISALLPSKTRIARVMPNTPALVGAGASCIAAGPCTTQKDADVIKNIFSAVGTVANVEERLLDAVTGLSGSGPAYIYILIEALSDGGVRAGLPRHIATTLAAQTVFGAAKMAVAGDRHTAQLKDAVASPGGTTIAGIHALEKNGFRGCVIEAVVAATNRSIELSQPDPPAFISKL